MPLLFSHYYDILEITKCRLAGSGALQLLGEFNSSHIQLARPMDGHHGNCSPTASGGYHVSYPCSNHYTTLDLVGKDESEDNRNERKSLHTCSQIVQDDPD